VEQRRNPLIAEGMTSSVSGAKVRTRPRGYLGDTMWRRLMLAWRGDRWIDPVEALGLDR
jgi:hypothetical protein